MTERLGLGPGSLVIEVASNDGYLLRNFVGAGVPCLGIEPAASVARAAETAGVPTEVAFLTPETAAPVVPVAGTPESDPVAIGVAAVPPAVV